MFLKVQRTLSLVSGVRTTSYPAVGFYSNHVEMVQGVFSSLRPSQVVLKLRSMLWASNSAVYKVFSVVCSQVVLYTSDDTRVLHLIASVSEARHIILHNQI
eukprot:scpid70321/ scgid10861/ 